MSQLPPRSPSLPPQRQNRTQVSVSSLVEQISPKIIHGRNPSNGRITGDEEDPEQASIPGGERASPPRATVGQEHHPRDDDDNNNNNKDYYCPTFCIDSDDDESDSDCDCDCEHRGREQRPPELPSLFPLETTTTIPANYICPLTLQIMEDPVHDSCGHVFERRAIVEWLDRSNNNNSSNNNNNRNSKQYGVVAVCPISRKPLLFFGGGGSSSHGPSRSSSSSSVAITEQHTMNDHHYYVTASSLDRVLKRDEGLQQRIQEWKMEHPLYQGVDAGYAQKQREAMLKRDGFETTRDAMDSTVEITNHPASLDCPYGDETIDGRSSNTNTNNTNNHHHHGVSRFERMFLPQEQELFLKILRDRSGKEHARSNRSRRFLVVISMVVALAISIWIGAGMVANK